MRDTIDNQNADEIGRAKSNERGEEGLIDKQAIKNALNSLWTGVSSTVNKLFEG